MSDVKIGLIGGTGLAEVFAAAPGAVRREVETPFGSPSDAIYEVDIAGVPVLFLARHGPGHLLPPSGVPYRANLFAFKQLGVTHVLASGAVGSLRQELKPRDLVVVDQVIDKTTRRAGTFFDETAVHVEFAEPFCPVLRQILLEAASAVNPPPPVTPPMATQATPAVDTGYKIHDSGTYVCMEGPAFSTRAESLMHRLWGGDLIGMTAMPEAKLAREAELPYALLALVTDYDCWQVRTVQVDGKIEPAPPADPTELLSEIIGNLKCAGASAAAVLEEAVKQIAANPARVAVCPAMHALKLAIWSDKAAIDPQLQQKLSPLWMKYFMGG